MDTQKRKADRYDSVGPVGMKHIDIEMKIESPRPSQRKSKITTANFVPVVFYYGCIIATVTSIIFSASVLSNSRNETEECFSSIGKVPSRQYFLLLPIFHILYSIALRNIPMKPGNHYYHSIFGFLCSLFYFVTAIYLAQKTWRCSSVLEKVNLWTWILLSFLWVTTWLYFMLTCFYLSYLKENPLELLLLLRCVCIPPGVKKVLLVFPYLGTAGSIFINADRLRDHECTLPLIAYSQVTALIIFLIGLGIASILFYGREHPVIEADLEDNANNENGGMDSSTGSSGSATTEIILMAAKKQAGTGAGWLSWLSLRYVLYMAGLLHAIAFFWACIGAFWHHVFSDMKCDTEIKQAAIASEFCLFFIFFADIAVFYLFKIESCFPSILDSTQFHSPFVEKGMKICKMKMKKAREIMSTSKLMSVKNKKTEYSRIQHQDIEF